MPKFRNVLFGLLVIFAIMLTACAPAAPAEEAAPAALAEEPAAEELDPNDPLAGVDPTGKVVIYWHQFSRGTEEGLVAMIDDFNATNEWSITVVPLAQGR